MKAPCPLDPTECLTNAVYLTYKWNISRAAVSLKYAPESSTRHFSNHSNSLHDILWHAANSLAPPDAVVDQEISALHSWT